MLNRIFKYWLFGLQNDFGAKLFDLLAFKIYDSVKLMRQYLTYLKNLEIINIPNYPDLYTQSQRRSSAETDVAPDPVTGESLLHSSVLIKTFLAFADFFI